LLLTAYGGIFADIEMRPAVQSIPISTSVGRFKVPASRQAVRFFAAQHAARALTVLWRRYNQRASLGLSGPGDADYSQAIERFQRSLPTIRNRSVALVSIVAVLTIAWATANVMPRFDPTLLFLFHPDQSTETSKTLRGAATPLGELAAATLTLNLDDLRGAVKAFACVPARRAVTRKAGTTDCRLERLAVTSVSSLLLLAFAVGLVGVLTLGSFFAKRRLFALERGGGGARASAAAGGTKSLYELERETFAAVGSIPPRELPYDLVVAACLLVIPLWAGATTFIWTWYGLDLSGTLRAADVLLIITVLLYGSMLIAFSAGCFGALRRTKRRRDVEPRPLRNLPLDPEDPTSAHTRTEISQRSDRRRRVETDLIEMALGVAAALPLVVLLCALLKPRAALLPLIVAFFPTIAALCYEGVVARTLRSKWRRRLRVVVIDGSLPSRMRLFVRNIVLRNGILGPAPLLLIATLPFLSMESYVKSGLALALAPAALAFLSLNGFAVLRGRRPLYDIVAGTDIGIGSAAGPSGLVRAEVTMAAARTAPPPPAGTAGT
jgi:hypothetical protein